jgi:NAD(P)-dependent dehydrogenase (short-subunit alcohol dehydrogenase family)
MRDVEGRTAVLTGAAKLTGLGFAFAEGLAREGANIVIADVLDGSEAVERLRALGRRATYLKCDVSSEEAVADLSALVDRDYGGCDILIHAATVFHIAPLHDIGFKDWRKVVGVNLDAMYLLAHAFVPGMKARGWGRIIPISSNTYHAGSGNRVHYVSSKAALIGFARGLGRELGNHGITVNALVPGLVRTVRDQDPSAPRDKRFEGRDVYEIVRDQQSIGTTLLPEHLVGPLLFLASDASAYMTGQALLVDGGWFHIG